MKRQKKSSSNQNMKDAYVIHRQNYVQKGDRKILPQQYQLYYQNLEARSQISQFYHPSLVQTQNQTQHYNFNDVLASKAELRKQGAKQEQDTRQKAKNYDRYPYDCYGKVKAIYQKERKIKTSQGIAAFIGKGLMLTAAHVVPNQFQQFQLTKIQVHFQNSKIILQVQRVLIHPQYTYQGQNSTQPFDMAILVIKANKNFKYPEKFLSIKWNYDPKANSQNELTFLTYKEAKDADFELWKANHKGILVEDQWKILYKNTTYKGDSGSPILYWNRKQDCFKIVGIHIGEYGMYNYGILLTKNAYSPKDIFSQMIEYDLFIQQKQQMQNKQQKVRSPSAVQIVKILTCNQNYLQSTKYYIKQLKKQKKRLEKENQEKELQIQRQQKTIETLQNQLLQIQNDTQNNRDQHVKTQIELPQQTQRWKQFDTKTTPKKYQKGRKDKENQSKLEQSKIKGTQKQNQTKGVKPKTKSKEKKPLQQKDNPPKDNSKGKQRKRTKQQQSCLAQICNILTNWIRRRSRAIANDQQATQGIIQP